MKKYFSLACALIISTASFAQSINVVKRDKLPAPPQNTKSKQIVRKSIQLGVTQGGAGNLAAPFKPQLKNNPLLSIGQFNQPVAKMLVAKNNSENPAPIEIDTRDLKFSENGLLLSPDGYEIEFRTSGNRDVTDVCATPRPYIINSTNKNAACSFTVPCDDPANRDATNIGNIKYFQLRWHVMMNGGATSNIDQAMIDAMMVTLNADYAAHNMVFCEDSARWVEDAVNYFHDSNTEEVSLKTAYNQRPADLINIYVVGDMTAGGYARFPYDPMGGPNFRGGIVMNRSNCNATGHTLAHEMGHTFGLEHTFAGVDERAQCSDCYERVRDVASGSSNSSGIPTPLGGPYANEGDREGDWCSDTNPHNTNTYNCNTAATGTGACDAGPWVNAPVNNHMSYSFCDSQFTTQQGYRQHCMAEAYLASWTSYGGGVCGAQPPVAEFVGTPTTWGSPSNVVFTDLSSPTSIIDTWTWNFNNAGQTGTVVPATFNGQTPPTVVYTLPVGATACQDYEVTLTITSANGNDTETKTAYITVCPPAGDCDTLDTDYNNVGPTNTIYSGVNGLFTGVPNDGSVALADAAAFYEMYFTPNVGTSIVGGINVALGGLNDPDDDMTVQFSIYNDDGAGFPDLGGGSIVTQAYSPTALGVPNGGFVPLWIPITNPNTPIATATFHVGVEIFPGDATDSLYVISNVDGEGDGAAMTNFINSTGCGLEDFNDPTGVLCAGAGYLPVDFDMWIIPMMGEYAPYPVLSGFTETVVCDTTHVTLSDTVFYHDYAGTALVGMSYYFFSDGTTINTTAPLGTINKTYTAAGPDVIRITAVNECGRADTTFWSIPYNFMGTPDAEFDKTQPNDVCIGDVIDFTANTSGYQDYNWDFGDGTVASSGSSEATTHTYTAAGTYYTTLTTTSTGYQPDDVFYFEDFDAGIPAGYTLFDGDGQPDNYGINGSWISFDFNNDGDAEAVSSSWWNPAAPNPADDWLITPAIGALPANQMLSWIGEASDAAFPDGYEVRISTTGAAPTTVANFNTLLFSTTAENAFPTTRAVSLAAYAGQTVYIAFVNNSNDMNILMIDDVWVGTTGPGCIGSQHKDDFVVVIDCAITPPVADMTVTDSTGCAPLTVTFTDNSTVVDPIDTWVWNFGDGTYYTTDGTPPPHVYTVAGTYFASLEVCNAGGCTTDNISIVVGTGVTPDAGLNDTICGGTTATLAGNDPSPDAGMWTLISGTGTPTTPTAFGSAVTGLSAGLNEFAWTITGTGCTSVDTVGIFISTPVSAGTDGVLTTCSASDTTDLFTLLTGPETGGTWIGPSVLANDSIGTFDPATNGAGTYQYYVTGISPCTNDTADVVVTITPTDDPAFTYADFCAGSGGVSGVPTVLGGTYSFNPDPADGAVIVAGTGAISNEVAGSTYNVQYLTNGTCPDSLTIAVNIGTPVSAGADSSLTTCSTAGTVDLFTLLVGAQVGGTWAPAMASGTGVFDPAVDAASTYQYYVTGTAPCSNDTADVVVVINATDDPTFTYADFCAGSGGVSGVPTTAGGTYSFNPDPADGSVIVAGTGAISNAVAGSTYSVQYLTPVGSCRDSLTIAVNVGTPVIAGADSSLTTCSTAGTTDLYTLLVGSQIGGTWVPAMASGTGVFDPAVDAAGTYQYYVTGTAPCSNDTADVVVVINATDDPTFTYADFCAAAGGVSGVPTTAGGTYSFNPDLLDGAVIDANSGAITNAVAGTTYDVQYLTPVGPCRDSLTVSVTANGIPTVSNILETCNIANTDYAVSFDVSGGTGGPYTVTENLPGGIGGTFVVNAWTSNLITAGVAYDFDVDDANGCGPVNVSGNKICVCVSDAGTMDLTPLDLCETDVANATHNADHTLDPNDFIMYVLHTNNTATLGTVLDTNAVAPTFNFSNPPLTAGVQYYISAVVGDSLGNFVDFNDGCLQVAPGTPVTWEAAPDAGANDSTTTLCNSAGSAIDLNNLLTVPAGAVWAETTASGQFTPATGVFDANGLAAGVYAFTYTVAGTNCPNDVSFFGVTVSSQETAGLDDLTGTLCNAAGSTLDLNGLLNGNTTGGTWSETSASGQFTAGTGMFDGAGLAAGAYTFEYIVSNTAPCTNDTANFTVTISAGDNAGADDLTETLCNLGTTVDLNGLLNGNTTGGTWSETSASGQFTPGTGVFNGTALAAGVYTFEYFVTNTAPCANDTANFAVTISAGESAGNDDLTSTLCNTTGSNIDLNTLLVGNTTGGNWSETTASGQFAAGTGILDASGLAAGTYSFIYFVTNALPCANDTANFDVTITAGEVAGLDDLTHTMCNTLGSTIDLNTLLSGNSTAAGTWSETTTSGQFTAGTGLFDGNGLAVGAYNFIYFTTNTAPCLNDTANFTVTISASESAGLDHLTSELCNLPGATLDLNTLLNGNTVGGTWSETTTSTQLNTVTGVFDADGLTAGAYTFIYYVPSTLPCGNDTANFTVTVAACSLPVSSFTASALSVCVGDDITFTDNSTGLNINNWDWNFDFSNNGGATPAAMNGQGAHVVNYSIPGTYTISLNITDSVGTDDTTLVVTVTNCITPQIAANDTTVCAGDSLIFTDASTSTSAIQFVNWEFDFANAGGVFPTTGNQSSHTVFYTVPGTYTVKLTVSSATVTESVTRTITVTDCSPVAIIDTTGGSQTVCKDIDFATFGDLSTNNPTSYLWTFPGGTPDTSTSANPGAIIYDSVGTYAVTLVVSNEYGSSVPFTFSNAVNVIDCTPAVAHIVIDDEDGEICEDGCINFVYKDTLGVPTELLWTYEVLDSDTIRTDTVPSFNPDFVHDFYCNNSPAGTYKVKVYAWNQYNLIMTDTFSVDSMFITVHPKPIINAGNDVTVEYSFDTYLQAHILNSSGNIIQATGGSIEWSPTTYLSSPNDLGTAVVQPLDTTLYTVTYTDDNGCIASDDVTVNVDFIFNIGVPSAFTPNSSFNNILYVKGELGIKSMNFVIYNRYGQKVFETTDVEQGWDGTHNGKTLNPGVFVYYVKATFINGSKGEIKGNVTLIK